MVHRAHRLVGVAAVATVLSPAPLAPLEAFDRGPALGGASPLMLTEVLASLEGRHPALVAADARVRAAEGQEQAAHGAFDLQVQANGWAAPAGYYRYGRSDFILSQATPLQGASLTAGWRLGQAFQGSAIPGYYGHLETLDAGEFRAGVSLPLLRDGPVDARRAGIERTARVAAAARAEAAVPRLRVRLAASEAWIRWAAAAGRLQVARDLLALAEDRDAQIGARVGAGALPALEHLENRRAVLERRQGVVTALRALERSALALGFHWRDQGGVPQVPTPDRAPADWSRLSGHATTRMTQEEALQQAMARRPEIARWQALQEAGLVQLRLAENQVAPRVDVSAMGAVDAGLPQANGQPVRILGEPALELGVTFQVPLGQREARGRAEAARADLGALDAEFRQTRDQIRLEVQDALSALRRATEARAQAREAAAVAERVAEGERQRFAQGLGTLLLVNLREMAAAQARQSVVDAEAELAVAEAQLLAATGQGAP